VEKDDKIGVECARMIGGWGVQKKSCGPFVQGKSNRTLGGPDRNEKRPRYCGKRTWEKFGTRGLEELFLSLREDEGLWGKILGGRSLGKKECRMCG